MNRLPLYVFLALCALGLSSGRAYSLCASNICSAELPNDSDIFRSVGRISVQLRTNVAPWTNVLSKDVADSNPFDGSCECQAASSLDMKDELEAELSDLRLTYDYYSVECFAVPATGGSRAWIAKGRFSIGDTSKTYVEWARSFCGADSYRYKSGTDLIAYRFETAAAFLNDADNDGLGAGDDHCDNSVHSANFGWDAHRGGTVLLGADAADQRGCFGEIAWPAPETKGMSLQKQCTVVVKGRALNAGAKSEIFRMNTTAPALVLNQGETMKAAAESILKLQQAQGAIVAHCRSGNNSSQIATANYGRAYAEWKASGLCGGDSEVLSLEFIPLVQDGEVSVSCIVENDSDADGVGNAIDACPATSPSAAVFPDNYSDESKRGCAIDCGQGKEFVGDSCVLSCPRSSARLGTSTQCQCDDGTAFDPSVGSICEDKDEDKDGVVWPIDQCPHSAFPAVVDAKGCEMDLDRDGVADTLDRCPLTPAGTSVDALGCGLDSDGDGVEDSLEYVDAKIDCRNSTVRNDDGSRIASNYRQVIKSPNAYDGKYLGCLRSDVDTDNDGVANSLDLCPATPPFEVASKSCGVGSKDCGCSLSDLDSDNDGVRNADDICPSSPGPVQNQGCANEDMNAAPTAALCPVPSLEQLNADYYNEMIKRGQSSNCQGALDVVDAKGRNYGSVCSGTEGYAALALEKNLSAVVSKSADLSARAACYLRGHNNMVVSAEYIAPLYQDHLVKIWNNRELLSHLSASSQYSCQALLNDYNVHVSNYHGMNRQPLETLGGHETGEAVSIFGAGALDASAEASCGLYRPNLEKDPNNFLKLYP